MVQGRGVAPIGARSAACSTLAALQLRRLQCAQAELPLDSGLHHAQYLTEHVPKVDISLCPGPRSTAQPQDQRLTGQQQNPPELPPPQPEYLDLECRRLLQQRMRRSVLLCNVRPTAVALMSLQQRELGHEGGSNGLSRTQEAGQSPSSTGQLQQPSAQLGPMDLPWARLASLGHQAEEANTLEYPVEAVEKMPAEVAWAGVDSATNGVNAAADLLAGPASGSRPGSSGEPDAIIEARLAPLAKSLCKYVEPGLVPAVQLLHRAEARLLSSITHEQYQHGDKQHEQQQQQKKQQQQHAGVVTPEEEAIAIRIMLAWLQHSLPGSSSSSSSSSSTLSQKTCSPAGDAADADADAAAAAAQGRQQRHCSGDAAPDLVASLVSQLRQEWQEEQKAGGMADAVRPYLATVRQPGARIDLRDLRALTLAGQRGGAPPGSDWAAALEAAEQGDQDMHDVLSSAVMGTLITGQYKPQGRCGQPPCADLLTSAAVPLVLSIAQDANQDTEAAAQLPARLIHNAVHFLPNPLLLWLWHVVGGKLLPEDFVPVATSSTAGGPSGSGNGPGNGGRVGTEGGIHPSPGIHCDPIEAKRMLQRAYFGGHAVAGVGQTGPLQQVHARLARSTLMGVSLIQIVMKRHPVALGALAMAWEELAARQQQAQAGAEGLGGPGGMAADEAVLTHAESVLLAVIQWERRRMQQRQQQQQAGWVRSEGNGEQQGVGVWEVGCGQEQLQQQQQQQQQQQDGEGQGARGVGGPRAETALNLGRMEQQNPALWHRVRELPATCWSAGPAPAAGSELAAVYLWLAKLLHEVTSQLEPLYGPGSMPRIVLERAAYMLVGVAAGPHGRVLLGGSCARADPMVAAVAAELEAATVRVTEQLLPCTPVGVLLHGAWWASENDQAHRVAVTDRWCREGQGQGQGKAAGPGRQRRRVLDLARSWEVEAADVGEAVEVLRPGLLRDPVSGPAWRLAVALADGTDDAEQLAYVLLQYALAGLSLVAGHDLPLGRLQLGACAVAGLFYYHSSQTSTGPHAEADAVRTAVCLLMCLSYVPVVPDVPSQPPQPPDACAASQPPQLSPPPTAEDPTVSNLTIANLQIAEHLRTTMGLSEFSLDPEGCAAQAACVYDAVTATAQRDGQAPPHSQQGGSLLYGHSIYAAALGAGTQPPRAACGAVQDRVLAAAKLLATSPYRPGRRWDYLLPVGAVQGTAEGVCGSGGSDGGSSGSGGVQGSVEQGEGQGQGQGQAGTAGAGALGPGVRVLRPGMRVSELLAAVLACALPGGGGQQEQLADGGGGRQGHGQGVQQQLPVRAVACGAEQLALLVMATHRFSDEGGCYSGTVLQPSVDAHLANVLLAGDTPVTEEAAYNPPPGATSVTVLDVHYAGAVTCSADPAVQAARMRHQLEKVTDKVPRFSDALKRLREALVDKPRVSATWVVAQGVGGLQRALLMVAKVREELLAQHRDLTVWVVGVAQSSEAMDAAELEQLEEHQRLKKQQQQDNKQKDNKQQQPQKGVSRGGRGAAAPNTRGAARESGPGSWLEGPWVSRELRELHWNLCATLGSLAHMVGLGQLQLGEDGSIGVSEEAARWELEQAEGLLAAMLRLLRDPGCVVRDHVRVELLLQEVEPGRVDRLVSGREEDRAAAEAAGRGAGGKRAADGAGRKHTKKEMQEVLFQ